MAALIKIMNKDSFFAVMIDIVLFASPLCIAASIGLFVGWVWKPKWALGLTGENIRNFDGNRFLKLESFKHLVGCGNKKAEMSEEIQRSDGLAVNTTDLKHFYQLVKESDGGPIWDQMMDKTMPNFSYRAWKREPKKGPPEYRSSIIVDDATPEVVKDFFLDDEFRTKNKWDDLLLEHTLLEKCTKTGTVVVRWVKRMPFFCSNREYIIGRRIWNVDGTYYCITKAVPRPAIPRHNKPIRVDLYYSSMCIRAVESRQKDGRMTACEILVFHQEDIGIPREIFKLGVKQGMWSVVKKIEPGLRAYQALGSETEPFSEYAAMAKILTQVSSDYLKPLELNIDNEDSWNEIVENVEEKKYKPWAMFIIGGAVVAASILDQGLLSKAVLFGVARKFGRFGK